MEALRYARVPTAHGDWWLAWSDDGVCAGAQPDWDEARFVGWVVDHHRGDVVPGDPAAVPDAIDWRFVRTGFRRAVLEECARIPEGEVASYGELAAAAGRPRAARAVGTTMATNPLPPLVPCHRVVRGDGRVGEYGAGGTERKAEMLTREAVVVRDGVVVR